MATATQKVSSGVIPQWTAFEEISAGALREQFLLTGGHVSQVAMSGDITNRAEILTARAVNSL